MVKKLFFLILLLLPFTFGAKDAYGLATATISPSSGTYNVGSNVAFTVNVSNASGVKIVVSGQKRTSAGVATDQATGTFGPCFGSEVTPSNNNAASFSCVWNTSSGVTAGTYDIKVRTYNLTGTVLSTSVVTLAEATCGSRDQACCTTGTCNAGLSCTARAPAASVCCPTGSTISGGGTCIAPAPVITFTNGSNNPVPTVMATDPTKYTITTSFNTGVLTIASIAYTRAEGGSWAPPTDPTVASTLRQLTPAATHSFTIGSLIPGTYTFTVYAKQPGTSDLLSNASGSFSVTAAACGDRDQACCATGTCNTGLTCTQRSPAAPVCCPTGFITDVGSGLCIAPATSAPAACGLSVGSACCATSPKCTVNSSVFLHCTGTTCSSFSGLVISPAQWFAGFNGNNLYDLNSDGRVGGKDYALWLKAGNSL